MKRFVAPLLVLFGFSVMLFSQPLHVQDSIVPAPTPQPVIISVTNLAAGHESELRVSDRIRVQVDHLKELIAQKPSDTSRLLLYLDSIPMTDIKATYYDVCDNVVFFDLKRQGGSDPWDIFYQSPLEWNKTVSVSIGYYNVCAVPTTTYLDLIIIRKGYFWIAVIIIALMCILLVFALKRGLIRDDSILPPGQRPFSLSRSQLMFWTFIIAVCYVLIALVTGELAPLTTSTLILLGISGLTTATASTIDSNDKLNNVSRQQDVYASNGFLNDVLSDVNGISVNRFQMLLFNAILGVFFVQQVFTKLQMPDFDNNLLILMGLSNGTYAGLKINENKGAGTLTMPTAVNNQITDDTSETEDVPPVG
jgi:hypothetical protein